MQLKHTHTLNQLQMIDWEKQCMLGQLARHTCTPKPVHNEEKKMLESKYAQKCLYPLSVSHMHTCGNLYNPISFLLLIPSY